jgi:hypothetical protein
MAPGNLKVTVWRPAVVLFTQPCEKWSKRRAGMASLSEKVLLLQMLARKALTAAPWRCILTPVFNALAAGKEGK